MQTTTHSQPGLSLYYPRGNLSDSVLSNFHRIKVMPGGHLRTLTCCAEDWERFDCCTGWLLRTWWRPFVGRDYSFPFEAHSHDVNVMPADMVRSKRILLPRRCLLHVHSERAAICCRRSEAIRSSWCHAKPTWSQSEANRVACTTSRVICKRALFPLGVDIYRGGRPDLLRSHTEEAIKPHIVLYWSSARIDNTWICSKSSLLIIRQPSVKGWFHYTTRGLAKASLFTIRHGSVKGMGARFIYLLGRRRSSLCKETPFFFACKETPFFFSYKETPFFFALFALVTVRLTAAVANLSIIYRRFLRMFKRPIIVHAKHPDTQS